MFRVPLSFPRVSNRLFSSVAFLQVRRNTMTREQAQPVILGIAGAIALFFVGLGLGALMEFISRRLGLGPKEPLEDQPGWRAGLASARGALHFLGPIICGIGALSPGMAMGDKGVPLGVTKVLVGAGLVMTAVAALLGLVTRLPEADPNPKGASGGRVRR